MKDQLFVYKSLNESYNRKFVCHFGTGLGFYSELNSLLLSVLYCLKYKYQFTLYSKDCNFSFGNGWNEFFLDFCPEFKNNLIGKCIVRDYFSPTKKNLICHLYKLLSHNLIMNDTYWYCRSAWFENEHFLIPELGINGDLKSALKTIIPIVYRFNDKYRILIEKFTEKLNLPERYASIHVRGGDKITERSLFSPQVYLDVLKSRTDIRDVFVFTDDYNLYLELKKANPQFNLITSAFEYETGFINSSFLLKEQNQLQTELVKILSSVDIILKSELFVGTYSSNPGLFIGALIDNKMVGLDFNKWLII